MVKSGDFKRTAPLGWGRQAGGGNGGRAVAGTEVGVAFRLMPRRLQWCLRRAEGAVPGAGARRAAGCARQSRVGTRLQAELGLGRDATRRGRRWDAG